MHAPLQACMSQAASPCGNCDGKQDPSLGLIAVDPQASLISVSTLNSNCLAWQDLWWTCIHSHGSACTMTLDATLTEASSGAGMLICNQHEC